MKRKESAAMKAVKYSGKLYEMVSAMKAVIRVQQ